MPSKYGLSDFSRHALFRAFIQMKCEKFAQITDLKDFLENNLILGFLDITPVKATQNSIILNVF